MQNFSHNIISSIGTEKHCTIPQQQAVLFRFPRFLMCPSWYQRSNWYTWECCIHNATSGKKGILPYLIRGHFFSVFSIESQLCRSNLFNSCWNLLLEYCVCRIPSFLIRQCLAMFASNLSMYFWVAPLESLVLNLLEVNRWTLKGGPLPPYLTPGSQLWTYGGHPHQSLWA